MPAPVTLDTCSTGTAAPAASPATARGTSLSPLTTIGCLRTPGDCAGARSGVSSGSSNSGNDGDSTAAQTAAATTRAHLDEAAQLRERGLALRLRGQVNARERDERTHAQRHCDANVLLGHERQLPSRVRAHHHAGKVGQLAHHAKERGLQVPLLACKPQVRARGATQGRGAWRACTDGQWRTHARRTDSNWPHTAAHGRTGKVQHCDELGAAARDLAL